MTMFSRRTLLFGAVVLAFFALTVTAGKGGGGKPKPPPPPPADPAILYTLPDGSGGLEVWVMNDDGSNQTPVITYDMYGLYAVSPMLRWSGDNSRLLFLGRPVAAGQPADLYVADSDGSNVTRVIDNEFVEGGGIEPLDVIVYCDWAPAPLSGQAAEDEWILLSAHVSGGSGTDLYAVRLDGTGLVQLTDTPGIREDNPCVAPDGKSVLFSRGRNTTGQDYLEQVFKGTLGTDAGTGLPAITAEECITNVTGSPLEGKDCYLLSLDPTGTRALVGQGSYRWLVPLADPTGAWLVPLADTYEFSWLDTDTVVYAFRNSSQKWFIAKADVSTGVETIIASFGKTQPGYPDARRWFGP